MSPLSEPAPEPEPATDDGVGRRATALHQAVASWGPSVDRDVEEHRDEVISLAAAFDSFLANGPTGLFEAEDLPIPPIPPPLKLPLILPPPDLPGAFGAMQGMIRRSALAPKVVEAALAWVDAQGDGSTSHKLVNAVRAYRGQEPLT